MGFLLYTPKEGAVITGFGNLVLGTDYKYCEMASWFELLRVFGKKLWLLLRTEIIQAGHLP